MPHLFPAFWNGPGRKHATKGNPKCQEAVSPASVRPSGSGKHISRGRACKRILKMSSKSRRKDRSSSHSLSNFPLAFRV